MILLFDLDDTLYPEIDFLLSGYRKIASTAQQLGLIDSDTAYNILSDNRGPMALVKLAAATGNSPKLTVSQMVDIYRYHTPDISLAPQVSHELDKLRSNPVIDDIGLITDGRTATQTLKIKALGLHRWINPRLTLISESIRGDKLSGIPQREIERLTGCRPCDHIYVGDNPAKDFLVANNHGWTTIYIKPGKDAIHPTDKMPSDPGYHPLISLNSITRLNDLINERFCSKFVR